MWYAVIIGIVVYFLIDYRLRKIEAGKKIGESKWINVEGLNAILAHPKLGEVTGIKSAKEGKSFKDWTKAEKDKWKKDLLPKAQSSFVHIAYLSNENAYYVNCPHDPSLTGLTFRHSTTNLLHSAIVAGDEDGFDKRLEFYIYERLVKGENGKNQWRLVPCIEYFDGEVPIKKDFTVLCEFPLFEDKNIEEQAKKLGFDVNKMGGDDFYTNSFGEGTPIPTIVRFSKNGVIISESY